MAYQRLSEKKVIAISLGSFIDSQLQVISKNREKRNLDDESKFNKAVLEDNLTLEQQLNFRTQQLSRVLPGDKEEKRRIRDEISTLKNLIEQEQYDNEYLEQVTNLNSGIQSIESTISWLNSRLASSTDSAIQKSIKENIATLSSDLYAMKKTALQNQTSYANNDKTDNVINAQIDRINTARTEAINAGNDDYVSLLDLQLQSLKKTKAESSIQKTILDYSVATMTGQSAISLLNEFNSQISSADDSAPVTIGGTTYDNAKQFWELQRSDYLNDRSENGFFSRYSSELNSKIDYSSSRGILTNNSLTDVKNWYESIKSRPELSDYLDKISQDQQSSLQSASDKRAASILNEFATKLDAKKAISDLAYLQDTYSVDQTLNYQKIVSSAAAEKESQVSSILSTMESVMKDNPGMTNQQALDAAIKSGAGATYSPEELATSKASDIITGMGKKSESQQFSEENPSITINPTAEGATFSKPNLSEGDLVKAPNSNTVYKYENGTLRAFSGNWSEELFKQYTGKGYSAVKTVPSVANLSQGSVIQATDVKTPMVSSPKYAEGTLIKTAGSNTVYKIEGNKLRAFTGAWDEQKFKQYTGQGFNAVKTVDSINDLEQGKEIKYQ